MADPTVITGDEAKKKSADDLFSLLDSSPRGLTREEAERRLTEYGPNSLKEEKVIS